VPLNHASQYSALTEAQYAFIGRAVVEWANVEFLLGTVLARLLATPEFLARTYTDAISAVRLQVAITEAVEVHARRYGHRLVSRELLDEVRAVNGRVASLRGQRNKLAHFCWMRTNDDELFGTSFPGGVPSPKTEKREYATLTTRDLKYLNDESHLVVEQLIKIVKRLPEITEESLLAAQSSGQRTAAARGGR